jgi:outer membrane receptor protein involved in Fe transport
VGFLARSTTAGLFGLFISVISAQAQVQAGTDSGVIHGQVTAAESLQPLQTASVSVRASEDAPVVAGELTGADGRFRITGLATGRYLVQISLLGYEPYVRREVEITSAATAVDLGTIELASSAIELQEIEVETDRPAMVAAPDRTIYSTGDMPVASGGMATDVLQNVPELEVEIDGTVEMRGETPQIYLNGRPAPMDGEALAVFLQQFPADRIDRVEVIPNPSARFEAQGSGGIVNIVLKENLDLGLSGSAFTNAGTRGDFGVGGRLAYQQGRLTIFGGGFGRLSKRNTTDYDLRQNLLTSPVTFLEQDGHSSREGLSGSVDLTAEFKLSEQGTLWSEGRIFRNSFDSEGVTVYTRMDAEQSPFDMYDRWSLDESRRMTTTVATGYRHEFEQRRHLVELSLDYNRRGNDRWNRVLERGLTTSGEPVAEQDRLVLDESEETRSRLRFDLDYTRPWGDDGQIEIGYRAQLDDRDTDRVYRVSLDGETGAPESSELRGYGFGEDFHSAYLTLIRSAGPVGIQVGLRSERVDSRLDVPQIDERVENTYTGIFPSANLSYSLGEGREVRLSYSRRIRRPQPRVLNPMDQSSDPLNRRIGNPDIDPQFTHSLSFETRWSTPLGSLRFSPYFRRTEDSWERIRIVDEAGVSTMTWLNLSSVDRIGSSFTASIRPMPGMNGFLSVSGFRESRDASNVAPDLSGSAMRWSARGNISARVTPETSIQGSVTYRPARDVPQGWMSSRLMTSFGIRHQLWDRRASINLMTTDPLDLYRSSFETRDPSHVQIGSSRVSMRRAVLSFTYTFGRPPRDVRQREPGDMEDDVLEPDIR